MSTSTPCSSAGAERGARAAERGAGRTLLLTGASRGIGHATVKIFAEAGWRVITCARRPFDPNCPWESGRIDHVPVDLADPAATGRAVARVKELIGDGPLHALVNNAGISPKTPAGGRLSSVDTPLQTWMDVFHVNFLAPVILARGLLDNLVAAGGSIVNLTSIAGTRVHPFAGAAYATSKAALSCLTREMAFDFAPYGVRVNAIAPGEIRTEILSAETEAHLAPTIPMRRIGTPAEVASVIYFLCSQHASYVTGEEVQINGGQHV
ncbi:short-chain dehydrogenase/reductase SDR [Methylobacterium sp. 4-46]|uniref:SDR family NAD(P)-dependent oxidoreductase n=1 Tax=unclassified Methylobacterium TaxID=2615210 RepID=UPI000152D64C|nr:MULTISPECIES: SDR family oxidoreductase [Methylobacterium]ACA17928.1 short-chain dehydrogenase/reductase SDR [Methylobacterium sp. 4-46]WFT77229.1 SDR family NAD(P)-dependent oxidoreductase [Methylobacterium nodulans]